MALSFKTLNYVLNVCCFYCTSSHSSHQEGQRVKKEITPLDKFLFSPAFFKTSRSEREA